MVSVFGGNGCKTVGKTIRRRNGSDDADDDDEVERATWRMSNEWMEQSVKRFYDDVRSRSPDHSEQPKEKGKKYHSATLHKNHRKLHYRFARVPMSSRGKRTKYNAIYCLAFEQHERERAPENSFFPRTVLRVVTCRQYFIWSGPRRAR